MGSGKSQTRGVQLTEQRPISIQLLGNDPRVMAEAARYQVDQGADIIDINMGCPAKKVLQQAAGSALLADEARVAEIVRRVVLAAAPTPVTLKIRTGVDIHQRNAVRIAKIAEEAGIALLAIHGRTRADKFMGQAEYDTIAQVVQSVSIPVIANGDITTPEQALAVFAHTQAAGIMIGRGANGRPWFFSQIIHFLTTGQHLASPSETEVLQIIHQHQNEVLALYGHERGERIFRKHLGFYGQQLRVKLVDVTTNLCTKKG
jgi:tRNA-dihydrouridine synthase B